MVLKSVDNLEEFTLVFIFAIFAVVKIRQNLISQNCFLASQ